MPKPIVTVELTLEEVAIIAGLIYNGLAGKHWARESLNEFYSIYRDASGNSTGSLSLREKPLIAEDFLKRLGLS